jgi:hypothetical protein
MRPRAYFCFDGSLMRYGVKTRPAWSPSTTVVKRVSVNAVDVKSKSFRVVRGGTRFFEFDPRVIRNRTRLPDCGGQLIVVTLSSGTAVPAPIAKIEQLGKHVFI